MDKMSCWEYNFLADWICRFINSLTITKGEVMAKKDDPIIKKEDPKEEPKKDIPKKKKTGID